MAQQLQDASDITETLRKSGPTVDLSLSNAALGVSPSYGYLLARGGDYPVKVLMVGRRYKVITSELLTLLGIERPDAGQAA